MDMHLNQFKTECATMISWMERWTNACIDSTERYSAFWLETARESGVTLADNLKQIAESKAQFPLVTELMKENVELAHRRYDALISLTLEMKERFQPLLDEVGEKTPQVVKAQQERAIVVTGAGNAFQTMFNQYAVNMNDLLRRSLEASQRLAAETTVIKTPAPRAKRANGAYASVS